MDLKESISKRIIESVEMQIEEHGVENVSISLLGVYQLCLIDAALNRIASSME